MYNVISTGSTGNAIIYHNSILVDCGVPYSLLAPYKNDIQLILLTHCHGDHLNISTLKRLQFERPGLRIGCGEFLVEFLEGLKNIDVYSAGKVYDYSWFKVSPVILYHDVKNFGYRIFMGEHKTLHCTDTYTLQGISAKNYDLYAIEFNYDEDTVWETIIEKESRGEFAHQRGSINSHLSRQQAQDFILKNAVDKQYNILRLHESKSA